jgi:hypothetical protein
VRRHGTRGGQPYEEEVYGISSLDLGAAGAAALLGVNRAGWGIENQLHHVRDVTLGEDACRVRRGAAPQVLAALRNAAVYLLTAVAADGHAAALRRLAARPAEALHLLDPPK